MKSPGWEPWALLRLYRIGPGMPSAIVTDERPDVVDIGSALWTPRYPPSDLVPAAAALLEWKAGGLRPVGEIPEGPRWWVKVSGGGIRIGSTDLARGERAVQRVEDLAGRWIEELEQHELLRARLLSDGGDDIGPLERPKLGIRGVIDHWSPKSRARMLERFSTLDYLKQWADRPPAMVTLTMPADWWTYAPNGAAFKKIIRRFVSRYRRAWGPIVGLWKQELQRRGAPHVHILMQLPLGLAMTTGQPWREWLADAWAGALGVTGEERAKVVAVHRHRKAYGDLGEGLRASDPRRIAAYFLKHGSFAAKEYQHRVPDLWAGSSVGRWWGYWGLDAVEGVAMVGGDQATYLRRTLRRWARANHGKARTRRWRIYPDGRCKLVATWRRRLGGSAGWLLLEDGPGLALALAAAVDGWGPGERKRSGSPGRDPAAAGAG